MRGLQVDLVVLKTTGSSYLEPTRDELAGLLDAAGAREFLGRKGGIHLLSTDQIGPGMMQLLESVARVIMDEDAGSLPQQIALAHSARREIPAFQPVDTPDDDVGPALEKPTNLQFENGLGGFTADGREYVIHLRPGEHTPTPWCNVLANDHFGTLVTENGGGFTWSVNSGENRLTPWSNDPVCDVPGEVLYLRDEETGAIWTPTPFSAPDVACEVRHGLGCTRWRQGSHHIDQELQIFVPPDDPVKIIRLRLKNRLKRPRRVTATYYAEWLLGSMRSIAVSQVVTEYDSEHEIILARNPWNPDFAERVAFLAASQQPHSMTLDRHEFLGQEGNLRSPAGLHRWGLSSDVSSRVDPCAAYQLHVDLAPEEERELVFVLGQGADRMDAIALALKWRRLEQADAGFAAIEEYWQRTLDAVEVRTPDPAFDMIVNRWLLYQSISSRICARAGFYQAGGAIGFRDQLQDMLAVLHTQPERARAHILACAEHQFEEGDVMHWWHPPTDRGVRTRCSDDLLWLPYVTSCYVRATGDVDILRTEMPFLRAPPLAADEEDRYAMFESAPGASLFDHCVRALEHGVTRGAHGLPLIGSGDWNDGMDRIGRQGRGESVWLAWFSIVTLESFAPVARRVSRDDLADTWLHRAAEIRIAAEASAWDGEWYRRAYDDDGQPWGSSENEECRIDSISQSWAALAGAERHRVETALASAQRELLREEDRLVRLLTPPFDKSERDPGYIKAYPPGVRENGGQYTHAAAWLGFAFAHLGAGDEAYRIFDLLNPIKLSADPTRARRYRGEPYVLAADVADGGPHTGQAGWTWYTGSSAWVWRLGVEAIVGVRLDEGGISLSPCLPKHWKECEVTVRRPNGSLAIRIEDPDGIGAGAVELSVNGEPWTGNHLAFPQDGSTTQVIATIRTIGGKTGQHLRSTG
jgi:cyclic beta-1,2-glucan synthetase